MSKEIEAIAKKYDLEKDIHIYYNREENYTMLKRAAILKIMKKEKIRTSYSIQTHGDTIIVHVKGIVIDGVNQGLYETFGTVSKETNDFPFEVETAEKRADARLVKKIIFRDYSDEVFGEEEVAVPDKLRERMATSRAITDDLKSKIIKQ